MDLSHNLSLHRTTSHNDLKSEDQTIETVAPEAIIPYMTIIEQMPDACLVLDMQWRILYFNQQAAPFLPGLKADLLGHNIWETFPKILDSPLYAYCQQVKSTGKGTSFEYFAPVVNIWFQVSIAPLAGGICVYFRDITQRKQAEEIIWQSELRFKAIFNQSFSYISVLTPDGVLVNINELPLTISGFKREQVLGKRFWETAWWHSLPQEASILKDAISQAAAGKIVQIESAYLTSDSSRRIVAMITKPLFDEAGNVMHVIVEGSDITERKEAEARLRQSEKHFRALIENSNDGIALTDSNGILTYVSPLTTRITGFHPAEYIGHRVFAKSLGPDDYKATRQFLAQVLKQPEKSHTLEYRTRHKNGTYIWLEVVGINLLAEPHIEAIVWNFRDVTERKQLEQEIANAKEQLETILQNVAEGILVADTNYNIVYSNDSAARAFGFPSAAIMTATSQTTLEQLYKQFTFIQDEKSRSVPFEALSIVQALNGKKAQSLTQCQPINNHQVLWSLTKAQPIFDAQGKVQLAVSVFTDLTKQKEREQRKDHFISMASHELKTPLTIASAFTELLQEQFTAEGRQDVLRILTKLDSQINKLNKLVVDMLDISKMQLDQLALRREVVDINKLIHEVVENLQPTTNHRLLIEGEALHAINGDRDRLEQVMIILLSNAIKYSPQADSVIIKVAHTHDMLTVSVQDFGIGIAQTHQQKLFERFYRVLSDTVQTYPGLGIGLYLAREIIQHHGGKIAVESAEGQGSTFYISLPVVK